MRKETPALLVRFPTVLLSAGKFTTGRRAAGCPAGSVGASNVRSGLRRTGTSNMRRLVDAIRNDTLSLTTHRDVLRRRANDVDAYLSAPIATRGAR
jgi:hypothetical protein